MRKLILLSVTIGLLYACNKSSESGDTLATADLMAASSMSSELSSMSTAIANLRNATNPTERHYWDSAYHQHNAQFWHQHNLYHHNTYPHDDHSHQWVPYDSNIHHNDHHHPQYPGHPNDSIIVVTNDHHHNNCDHHPGHHICHHHTLDTLHHTHNQHHP